MSRVAVRPFLIAKTEEGTFRLTMRTTRMNMYNYPLVTSELQDEVFPTASAARAFATAHLGAQPGQFDRG
jgi:hypothetical protein